MKISSHGYYLVYFVGNSVTASKLYEKMRMKHTEKFIREKHLDRKIMF